VYLDDDYYYYYYDDDDEDAVLTIPMYHADPPAAQSRS
jgi:hypothetical protein